MKALSFDTLETLYVRSESLTNRGSHGTGWSAHAAILDRLAANPGQDRLQLQRLKKRKLVIKDQIQRLRTRLIPDIIA